MEVKISDSLWEKLDNVARYENIGTNELANDCIANAIADYCCIREGGVIAHFPVSDIKKAEPEKALEFLKVLKDLARKLYHLNANIEFPILNVIEAYHKAYVENFRSYEKCMEEYLKTFDKKEE